MIDCARAFVNVCLGFAGPFFLLPCLADGLAFFWPEERLVGADLRCGIFNI